MIAKILMVNLILLSSGAFAFDCDSQIQKAVFGMTQKQTRLSIGEIVSGEYSVSTGDKQFVVSTGEDCEVLKVCKAHSAHSEICYDQANQRFR